MDVSDLEPMVEELSGSVDDLEKALEPLLTTTVADTASKLPLLDKAKLQVLVTYALESILYSILKLNDVDAREHAVFDELNRVKQYFEKIKDAESGGVKKRENLSLDKAAAGRIIKHALSGNNTTTNGKHTRFEDPPLQAGTAQRSSHLDKKRKSDQGDVVDGRGAKTPLLEKRQAEPSLRLNAGEVEGRREDALVGDVPSLPPVGMIDETPKERFKADKQQKKEKGHKSRKSPKASNEVFQKLLNKPKKVS